MFLVGILSWWYGRGWQGQFSRVSRELTATADLFSIGQLFVTLFSPFRQISAGGARGSFSVVMRAFFDQMISRVIGAIVRLSTILIGCVVLVVQFVYEVVSVVLWVTVPLLPVAGFVAVAIGWVPRWM